MQKKKRNAIFIMALCIILIIAGVLLFTDIIKENKTENKEMQNTTTKVLLETNMGNITIELMAEQVITAGNFKSLVEKGTYNGVIFHRVIDGFMIQGGDPTGTGYGDPKIKNIRDEFNGVQKNNRGTLAMANAGPNTGSSQFFINLVNNNFLDGRHPVFGKVIEGMDVVDAIAKVETNSADKPLKEVKIISARVL